MRKKRSSDKGPEPEQQITVTTPEPSRRPSRRAAVEAAKKIYNTAHNYDVNGTTETPPQASESGQKSKKRREEISLEMVCEEEVLSPVQFRFQREAIQHYNLTMRNLRQLQACKNVRIIEERPNQPNVNNTSSAKTKSMNQANVHNTSSAKTKSTSTPLSTKALISNLIQNKTNAQDGVTQIIYV
ncbi:hypothetical protein JTE90_001957 [Oedothorax gibbosus]|uniref:Uncharacterized protein n=1 Tax=Oedothorax gibbosus TaxID=931172 RepID=A0AAV6VWJ9_9ARAC|nr:hypothetical protein JTE90_001957 [Oedothorax gibbosus]